MTNIGNVYIDTAKLDKITAEMKPKARAIVNKYGRQITGEAAMRAPFDIGNLRDKILSTSGMIGDLTYRVQDGVDYGIYQELGFTHWISGKFIQNPFMLPAVEKYRQKFLDAFEGLFK